MKTNTKQLPKYQLFDLKLLEQTEKDLENNNLSPNLLKMVAFSFLQFSVLVPPLVLHDFYGRDVISNLPESGDDSKGSC